MAAIPNILVVDDDANVLAVMASALAAAGRFRVTSTLSGSDALDLLDREPFDAMVLDLNMPEPDGFEVLKSARQKFPALKIVVVSGYMHAPLLQAALLVGGTAAIEKPIVPRVLVESVNKALASDD